MSPSASYNYTSHNTIHSSPSSHGTAVHSGAIPNQQLLAAPCQSSPHVNMGSPPSQTRPPSQVNITAQNNVSPLWNSANSSNYTSPMSNSSCANPQNGGFYNSLVQDNRNFETNLTEEKDPLSMSPTNNQPDPQRLMMQTQEKTFEQGAYSVQCTCTNILLYRWLSTCWFVTLVHCFRWQCGDGPVAGAGERGALPAAPGAASASAVDGRALRAAAPRPRQTGPRQEHQLHGESLPCSQAWPAVGKTITFSCNGKQLLETFFHKLVQKVN